MAPKNENVNTVAPLSNVGLCARALERAMNRAAHLPGMVCFYGPAGWGKTTAAGFCAARYRAYNIEIKEIWSRKSVLIEICTEIGIPAPKTTYEIFNAVCGHLAMSNRPLIIDQFDYLVDRKSVEFIRDLHDGSGATILLIGEEHLPKKLDRWERFIGRILDFVPAQPADIDDAAHLAKLYCPGVTIKKDLIKKIQGLANGSIRRICVNLDRVYTEALSMGLKEIGIEQWGDKPFYTGKQPARRV